MGEDEFGLESTPLNKSLSEKKNLFLANPGGSTKSEKVDPTQERIGRELKLVLDFLRNVVVKDGDLKGLVPYIDNEGSTKYRSEDLGYALRVAVNSSDQEQFKLLYSGVQKLKITEGVGKGLFRAVLDESGKPSQSEGTTWADGDQDIALALLEAGLKWGDQTALVEGKAAANAFISSSHLTRVGDLIGITATLAQDQENISGKHIRTINPSMYNFKLYELMQQLDPNNKQWHQLHESGVQIIAQTLEKFRLPPDNFSSVDESGEILGIEIYDQLDPNSANFKEFLAESVNPNVLASIHSKQRENFRATWSNDAVRIPYRLTDSSDPRCLDLSQQILQRLEKSGGLRKRIYADNGQSVDANKEKPGFVTAPLLGTLAKKYGRDAALEELTKNVGEWEKDRVYNQAWIGLGLSQIAA